MFTTLQEAQRKAKAEKQAAAGKGAPTSGAANRLVREGGGGKSHGHGHGGQATVGGEEPSGAVHHAGATHQHKLQTLPTHHHTRTAHTDGGKGSKSKSQVHTVVILGTFVTPIDSAGEAGSKTSAAVFTSTPV